MNNINLPQEKESDQVVSVDETDDGDYEDYRSKSLPEGYTAYKNTRQVDEVVYDRYNSVYSTGENPVTRRKFRCKTGRLSNVSKRYSRMKDVCKTLTVKVVHLHVELIRNLS